MSILDWLILIPIVGWMGWLLFRPRKKRCSGDCGSCCGCKHE